MGRTLFWYLFRDLLRIFAVAAIVLAGIMSFGGLLKPLTKLGLDAMQVGQMWLYLMPAMMTYSLPVAAVFATSMIYGRLAADNELTACRAAGVSYRSVCGPALALGLVAALISLLFLSYVVPFFSYQVERVAYQNVAKVVSSEIERTHAYTVGKGRDRRAIFAQRAFIPPDSGKDGVQTVVLVQPVYITSAKSTIYPGVDVPRQLSMAPEATLHIKQGEGDTIIVSGELTGVSFPRALGAGPNYGVGRLKIEPISMPSPLSQNVKFMDISRLKELAAMPEEVNRVKLRMKQFIAAEQTQVMLRKVADAIARDVAGGYTIASADPCQITAPGATAAIDKDGLLLKRGIADAIRVVVRHPGGRRIVYECASLRVSPEMDAEYRQVTLTLEMTDVTKTVGETIIVSANERLPCTIPMPPDVQAILTRKVGDYLRGDVPMRDNEKALKRETMVATNEVIAEMHSRASFGISCLVLVMVGAVLGMQFRSGDFLTAFAVSVMPALVTITLVVAGAQMATDVSWVTLENPIVMGLVLIWAGNVIAGVLATVLFLRIRRT